MFGASRAYGWAMQIVSLHALQTRCIMREMHSRPVDMKTAVLPSLRVKPELRLRAESVLRPDESLSSFMIDAVNDHIEHRNAKLDFLARGLASAEQAAQNGEYVPAAAVLQQLKAKLQQAKSRKK